MSYPHRFYAIVIPGLEEVAARELEQLSAHEIRPDNGGVHFAGTMETMFRVNLRSRCTTRVLMRLKRFTAMTLNELKQHCEQVDWAQFLQSDASVSVHASCHASKLMHTKKIEQEICEVIKRRGIEASDSSTAVQQLFIRIGNNRCLLSIDTSGERLERWGYRLESGKAPVRETLAAGVLQWMEWRPQEPLLVPMCGSGTFAIEAAMAAIRQAPGLSHEFPFLSWPQLKQKGWERVRQKAAAMVGSNVGTLPLYASDINPDAVEITRRNASRAGVEQLIRLQRMDARQLSRPDVDPGVIICNPPYGQRIDTNVGALYAALGRIYKKDFSGWRMAVFSPDPACEKFLDLPVIKRLKVKHGGKWVYILHV